MKYSFSSAADLAAQLSVSRSFLRDRRNSGEWQNGIHWTYLNPGNPRAGIRYNTELCMHWITCKGTDAHEQAVQSYLKTLHHEPIQALTGSK
ncbi:hypothetical protein [Leptolyngbya sp. BC1307]|uniref:hypothetical protein n=1 Tax=Leptolyngbya sp. BC1307 TaxID=2029589 RepID=UPI000EFB34C8|nr:hypothetical protein [Leptolyngbya sp. BC1307]